MRRLALVLALVLAPLVGGAVQPDEILDDPALEARARGITAELRCVVCQSESVDESNAEIARLWRDARGIAFHPANEAFAHEAIGKGMLGIDSSGPRW